MLYLRMTSITVSSMLLSVLAFLAANHKISGILDDLFNEAPTITVHEKEPPPLPKPPPPALKDNPPPPPVATLQQESATVVTIPIGEPQPAPSPAPAQITGATWTKKPGAREFDKYYPTRASEREKEGRVVLNCIVDANGAISCAVASETPEGWGFGEAAIQIAKSFRMAPKTINGEPTSGGTISVPIAFRLGG